MRIFYIFLLFASLGFAQINPLELKIDAITFVDSMPGMRIFKVDYHIKNTIDKDITFINCDYPLNTTYPDVKNLRVSTTVSENGVAVHENILRANVRFLQMNKIAKSVNEAADEKAYQEENEKALAKKIAELKAKREERLKINDLDYVKSSITVIKPNEIRNFTETYYWDKVRYYKIGDLEYYINENTPYFLELSMNFHKEQFQYFFSEEEYKKMKDNPNFIDGMIRSNQVEIIFKD